MVRVSERLSSGKGRSRRRKQVAKLRCAIEPLEQRFLLSASDLDPSFGTGGIVRTDFLPPSNDVVEHVVLQPDGKILAIGESGNVASLARYNPNGSLDTSFDQDGKLEVAMLPG